MIEWSTQENFQINLLNRNITLLYFLSFKQEPRSLYDEVKVVPLAKLDRHASIHLIKRCIEEEEAK